MRALLLVGLLFGSTLAWSFEEGVRREALDAGVHVPQLTRAPELQSAVEAIYPAEAREAGRSAEVTLVLTLDAEGGVAEATVRAPVGFGFDEAAVDAVKQFRFTPAEVDGVPAPVQLEYVYHFTLTAPPPPAPEEAPVRSTAVLQGRLVARGSRTRVEAGTVRCGLGADAPEASSDADGRFTLPVEAGVCQVSVSAAGYQVFRTEERLAPDETAEVVYHLLPKGAELESVVRGERDKKEVVKRTLGRTELQKIPGSFGDPVRVLQNFPGVARAPFLSGALIVRGANPQQTLTYLDGVEIPLLFHLGGGPSVVNSEFLDRIDFFPGGFGARYGRAIGGAVDVATRRGATDTLHGSVKVDLQDSSAFVEAPVGEGASVAAAVRRSYIDALIPFVLPKDPEGGSLLVLPRYWDYQVRADLGARRQAQADGASTYSLMAFGSDDVLKVVATGGGRERDFTVDFHTLFHRLVGNWSYRQGDLTVGVTPYLGYDLGTFSFGETKFRADEYELGLREDLALNLGSRLTLRTGVDILFDHQAGAGEFPSLGGIQYAPFPGAAPQATMQTLSREFESFDAAAFAELDLKLGSFTLTPGARVSSAFLNGQTRHAVEPRLWARYQLLPRTAFKGSIGLYQQPPQASDLEPAPFGNPYLLHERAFQTSLGVEQRFTDALHIDVTGFFNRRYQNVVSGNNLVGNDDGSVTVERLSNDGLGRAYGVEVLARHDVTKSFFGWLAYTWSRSQDRRVGGGEYVLNTYDQTHILTAVASYKLPWGFELGGRFRYVTGRPTTPLARDRDKYDVDANRFSSTMGVFRSARLKPFQQLDVRLEKSFLFDSWTLALYLDVQNVYNHSNVEGVLYDYRFRQEFEVPGIPLLPILGVKGSF